MRGIIGLASDIWWHKSLVIDLSELRFEWGDMVEIDLDPPVTRSVAVVVGPDCTSALASL